MKLVAVGGGSGGHVTPVLAVINELSKIDPQLDVEFICDTAFESQSRGLMRHALVPVVVKTIPAGKFRRYHGESVIDALKDGRTILLNLRDLVHIVAGFVMSMVYLIMRRPDVVFAKGGYVCLPFGLAASLLRIPLVIHDSDTRPGLTNKVLARFATQIGTGSPIENYGYDKVKTSYVGVPIQSEFHPFSEEERRSARHEIGMIDVTARLVVVTGGGLGARSINEAMVRSAPRVLEAGIHVYHVTGKKQYDDIVQRAPQHAHYITVPFVYKDMHRILGAADVVVSRASATFIQELAGLAKPTILIPASHLGDQVKNAAVYEAANAAVVMTDDAIAIDQDLGTAIVSLMQSEQVRTRLSDKIHEFARPQAAAAVAAMIKKAGKE
ncbi:MAG: glycosyltransferase [Candidatus Saccharimonadales bacterium]